MKKIFCLFILIFLALAPLACRQALLGDLLERLNGACARFGINERTWQVEKGYLKSTVSLQEPLATVWSGRGLKPEEAKFLRDYNVSLDACIENGPFNLVFGRETLELGLAGPAWRLVVRENMQRSLKGEEIRRLQLQNCLFEDGELLVCASNCWHESQGEGIFKSRQVSCKGGAEQLVLLPLGGLRGLAYEWAGKSFSGSVGNLVLGDDVALSNATLKVSWQDGKSGLCDIKALLDFSSVSSPCLEGGKGSVSLELAGCEEELVPDFVAALVWSENKFEWERFLEGKPELRIGLSVAGASGPVEASLGLCVKGEGGADMKKVFEALEGRLEIKGEAPLKKMLAEYFSAPKADVFQAELKAGKISFPEEAK